MVATVRMGKFRVLDTLRQGSPMVTLVIKEKHKKGRSVFIRFK